jgi:hypothetical protein
MVSHYSCSSFTCRTYPACCSWDACWARLVVGDKWRMRGVQTTVGDGRSALHRTIAALVYKAAIFGGRSQRVVCLSRARPTGLQTHVVHARGCPLYFEIPQLRLEVVDVSAAILDLPVEAREHGGIVSRLAHGIRGVDQGLLPVNLLLHIGHRLVDARHGGGCLV